MEAECTTSSFQAPNYLSDDMHASPVLGFIVLLTICLRILPLFLPTRGKGCSGVVVVCFYHSLSGMNIQVSITDVVKVNANVGC